MTIEKLIAGCLSLTPIESHIVDYIFKHKEDILLFSINDLATVLYVSKATILRFCKKLGFKGFNDFKVQLAKDLNSNIDNKSVDINYPFNSFDSSKDISDKILKIYESTIKDTYNCIDYYKLNAIVRVLNSADVIDIYASAHNFNIAETFKDKMLTIGKYVNCIENFYDQRLNASASTNTHIAIILSYSGRANWIPIILKKLKEKQIDVIWVGRNGQNLYPSLISYHLGVSDLENFRDRISQFSSSIAIQYMMDVLFGCIYNFENEKNTKYIHNHLDYIDNRKL